MDGDLRLLQFGRTPRGVQRARHQLHGQGVHLTRLLEPVDDGALGDLIRSVYFCAMLRVRKMRRNSLIDRLLVE
jgi:hypothetical protein